MPSSGIQELGRLLQEARERKGATIADAQQATKIRQSFLQALEDENYAILPPPFYIRGFIKTYAIFLGLDPRPTVQLFDNYMDGDVHSHVAYGTPSADSGGQTPVIPLNGLSQGEARMVEASNETLNLKALPAPSAPGTHYISGQSHADSGESRAIVPVSQRTQIIQQPYVLRPVMLPTTKGAFYIPNFIPTVVVVIIVAAALFLVYQGINQARQTDKNKADASATANAALDPYGLNSALTPLSGGSLTPGATSGSSLTPQGVLKAPPFFTPDASIVALDSTPVAGKGTGAGVKAGPGVTIIPATAVPAATPVPPTPIPPTSITVEVDVGTGDARGSWMTIIVDDQQKVAKLAAPGEVFTFQGQKIAVRAGNPGLITVKVNGQVKPYTTPTLGSLPIPGLPMGMIR